MQKPTHYQCMWSFLLLFLLPLVSHAQYKEPSQKSMKTATALLVMDMQESIMKNISGAPMVAANVVQATQAARKQGLLIIYLRAGFRKNAPEISPNNKFFFANRDRFINASPEQVLKLYSTIQPQEGDIVLDKRRLSAFAGTELELLLRARGIDHLVLAGVSTSGVVLSTVREAADKDYRLTVLSDGCGDADAEIHTLLMNKLFPRQADVLTVAQWMNSLPKQ